MFIENRLLGMSGSLAIACFLLSAIGCPTTADDDDDTTGDDDTTEVCWEWVSADETQPHGKTWGEWSTAWWEWELSISADDHPHFGGDGTQGQSGDVWFLAGGWAGTETRAITIPAGKAIYFPVRNTIGFACPEASGPDDCDWATEQALTAFIDSWEASAKEVLTCDVDGVAKEDVRAYHARGEAFEMPCIDPDHGMFYVEKLDFDCACPWVEGNVCFVQAGDPKLAVSGAYGLMVEPPCPGDYILHWNAANPDTGWELDLTYNLTIE